MAGVSEGASAAGGHVIGVTCDAIEAWRPGRANRWVREEIRHRSVQERLMHLLEASDGALVLAGGPGTLAEFALLWNLVQVGELAPRPIVLVGELWARTLAAFVDPRYVSATVGELVTIAPDASSAVELLRARIG